ncbi:activating transcription factor of chaperone isoform X2 [Apis mellifera]|uniref:Activating transcription factor of chaperone isoform X2 n=1 Tax=Apis mellifera TaxID=7460 RepID=A0A7M7MPP9_APIME|nr:activating transcription factor of chaperone isoform X2 [Apis mellifera]XP_026299093.1 activating transcription factor of chaperone isoform X2 [Apis mellifera]|eukprot:XP_006562898.1 activating transcription factor of chaperone isoform X2 [Apis mellifera]
MAGICYSEPFSDWLEEKIELPIFEELPITENGQIKTTPYNEITKAPQQDDTQTLLQEFETVLGDVEACHQIVPSSSSTLTPPQSPPSHKPLNMDTQLLVTLQPVQPLYPNHQSIYGMVVPEEKSYINEVRVWHTKNVPLDQINTDVAHDLAVVDEYVRLHTKDIPPSSPCTSSGGSYISSEDSVDDPDWIFESEKKNMKQSTCISTKNRQKPYSRPSIEDKKVRKKEQNKNAATRYRQKKKQEIKEILGEERELTEHNEKLKNQVTDLQREIGYLKGLMRDLFKAKGLIK